jgi:hypothetical protein
MQRQEFLEIGLRTVRSESLWIRFGSMWLLGLAILFFTWFLSFRSLPESILKGSSAVYYVPVKAQDVDGTFMRIFLWNICVGCIPVAIGSLARVKGVPLGYFLAFYHWGMYGILLGTNSFVIPGFGKILPSLTTLFSGSGIYEITAYTLISASTFALYYRVGNASVTPDSSAHGKTFLLKLSKAELALIVLAIVVLAVSNYYEAWNIFHM